MRIPVLRALWPALALLATIAVAQADNPPVPAKPAAPAATATPTARPAGGDRLPATGIAADQPLKAYQPPHWEPTHATSGIWLALRALVSLGVVLALIYTTAALVKAKGGLGLTPTGYRLRVIETVALGPARALHLVALGDKVLLVGAAGQGLNVLGTFTAAEVGYDPQEVEPPSESFLAKLQSLGVKS